MSDLGYLFHDKSSLHIIARDLDVERSTIQGADNKLGQFLSQDI